MSLRLVQAFLALAVFGSSSLMSHAQERGGPPPLPSFEQGAPKIGEVFPDIAIVDDQGNPVNVRELAGENYAVLVMGCLT